MCIVYWHQVLKSCDTVRVRIDLLASDVCSENDHPVFGFHIDNSPDKGIIRHAQKYKQKHKTGAYLI